MSTNRMVLSIKKLSDYKESTVRWEQDYSDFWNYVQTTPENEGLIGLIVNKHFSADHFAATLRYFDRYSHYNHQYEMKLANAFLYCIFVDTNKTEYVKKISLTPSCVDRMYVRDQQGKSWPMLHYAVHDAHTTKSTSALQNLLTLLSDPIVLAKQDDSKNTAFDLACEYQNETILNLLIEKSKFFNFRRAFFMQTTSLIYLLKRGQQQDVLINWQSLMSADEEILKSNFDEQDLSTLADLLLTKGKEFILKNRAFKGPIFTHIQSLFLAVASGNAQLVDNCLLSDNILKKINDNNSEGLSVSDLAVQSNRYDILCSLFNNGADITQALALTGPQGIAQLLKQANSSSSTAKDDLQLRRLLETYQTDSSLLEIAFSQLMLDILEKRIAKETLKKWIAIFPDLKDRLVKWIKPIIDAHKTDGIGAYFVKESLSEKNTLYHAFAEPRGRQKNVTRTIKNFTEWYGDVLDEQKPDEEGALALIRRKAQARPVSEELPEIGTQIKDLLPAEKAMLDLDLSPLIAEMDKGPDERNWRFAFAFAGPIAINVLLEKAKKDSKSHLLVHTLKRALQEDKKHLDHLFEVIKKNEIAPNILKQVACEQKDFSKRILNHLDTLLPEDAYDILDKSLTDRHNPFHIIWSPNGENSSQPPCSLVWMKYKFIKEQLLVKSRELAASHLVSTSSDGSSMAKILEGLGKDNISASDYKVLTKTPPVISASITLIGGPIKGDQSTGSGYKQKLQYLMQTYVAEIKSYARSRDQYDRLTNQIQICKECLQAIDQGKSIAGVRKDWESKIEHGPSLFKKSGLFSFIDNSLASVLDEIIKNEGQWVKTMPNQMLDTASIVSLPPPENPELYRKRSLS